MESGADTPLDVKLIAESLRPEDLDLPNANKDVGKNDPIVTTSQRDHEEATGSPSDNATGEEGDGDIPGIEETPGVKKAAKETITVATSSQTTPGDSLSLNSLLAKHGLQAVSSDEESEEASSSEEDSQSSNDEESSETESSDDSSDSDNSSSGPMQEGGIDNERATKRHEKLRQGVARLMNDDSDDDSMDDDKGKQHLVATAHEITVPQVVMPSITEVPEEEAIEQIGEVLSVVDSVVVVKSLEHGMHRVLDTESLLVFEDRKVLGFVFETFGPLSAPLYSVRFPSASHLPPRLTESSETTKHYVFYCPSRSTFAYTSQIRLHKGNDASNFYDEEVGEDELEFSDDEAEQEWKRKRKGGDNGKRKRSGSASRSSSVFSEVKDPENDFLPYDEEDGGSNSGVGIPGLQNNRMSQSSSAGPAFRGGSSRGRGRGRGRGRAGMNSAGPYGNIGQSYNPRVAHSQYAGGAEEYNPAFASMHYGLGLGSPQQPAMQSFNGVAPWSYMMSQQYQGPPAGLDISMALGGPAPGAYVNPQFAMMQMFSGNPGNQQSNHGPPTHPNTGNE